MIRNNKLLGQMVEVGYTQKSLAKKIGMSKNTLNAKVNGKTSFNTREINLICEVLGIFSNSKKAEIFLTSQSQKRNENGEIKN